MSKDHELAGKLYEISGPVLRLRIASELMGEDVCDKNDLVQMIMALPEVKKLMEYYAAGARLGNSYPYSVMVHGSKPEQLENVACKLWQLGIKKGIKQVDELYEPYIRIMKQDFYEKDKVRIGYGAYNIAQFLSLLGYAGEEPVAEIMQMRIDQVYSFVQKKCYDIYVDVKGYPKLPSSWKHISRIIDPALTGNGDTQYESPLPSMYDILGILGMKQAEMTKENEMKANSILKYCYDEQYYKNIMYKYGIMLGSNGSYYSMGWSLHLPGYGEEINKDIEINKLLLWADIFSNFSAAKEFPLFNDLFAFLENYRDNNGFYNFLKKFIPEEKQGYFVSGKYMGLGENRSQKNACLIESTFRVLKLRKNLGLYD